MSQMTANRDEVVVDLEELVVEDSFTIDAVPTSIVVVGAADSHAH
jgi:hypothetical protein